MRLSLISSAILLHSHITYAEKVETKQLKEGFTVEGNKVTWPDKPFKGCLECSGPGEVLSLSADWKHATCCPPGTSLKGSLDTEFHCCGEGHVVTGCKSVGFECCLEGSIFDGQMCKRDETCHNGKQMVNGKCQCPSGQVEGPDGACIAQVPGCLGHPGGPGSASKPKECSSGIQTGKCYYFTGLSGNYLTFNNNQYSETKLSKYIRPGKFQFCRDEKCTSGLPVNPSDDLSLKDLHGALPEAKDAGQWLNNKQNGGHIGKTADYKDAGKFSITKWPCGKYCLTGFSAGLAQACPDSSPGISLDTRATDSCIEFELLEVPCDIRANANNCLWDGGDQCCNKLDCSEKA